VLVGDAAHATMPTMGEGGAMALEDAIVLAEALRSGALETYEARRRPRAEWVQRHSRAASDQWLRAPDPAALRAHGDELVRERYRPLAPPP
jgi:2-polyprenyl-6-methoxyphenol hydroxylase-like FAD-dependent oxidoreductase